jgi:NADH-ubiquinone oxidoreductase chain 6
MLFLFNEAFTFGFNFEMLTVVFVGSILCGVGVITTKNPILSVLYLIGLFLNVAVYLMMVGIHFIGLSYLLVYVGAVSILFLFILMLINVRISELVTDNNNSIPLAIMIGSIFSLTLYKLFPSGFKPSVSTFKDNKKEGLTLNDENSSSI